MHKDGSVESLGNLGANSITGFAADPAGTRWMWGTTDGATSKVLVAGDGLAPRVVAQEQSQDRSLRPFGWTQVGGFIEDSPNGIGGYILFRPAYGPVQLMDPTGFAVKPIAHTSDCSFSDMASDGTIACFRKGGDQNSRTLELIGTNGSVKAIQLAMPRFSQYGNAYFSKDGRQLTVAGATNAGANGGQEQYGTDLVTTGDATIKRLPVDGVEPPGNDAACWLDDGSLIVFRPDGAAGGSAGVYRVMASGRDIQLGGRGTPIGFLSG